MKTTMRLGPGTKMSILCLCFVLSALTTSFATSLTFTSTTSWSGCPTTVAKNKTTYSNWIYTDAAGVQHSFGASSDYKEVQVKYVVAGHITYCGQNYSSSMTTTSTDGFYILKATAYTGSVALATVPGYFNPKYKIMGITYAPPGGNSNSSVSYADTTFVGNTSTNSHSFNQMYTFSISICSTIFQGSCNAADTGGGTSLFGFSGGAQITGTETDSWTLGSSNSTTITTTKQQALAQLTPGVPNVYSPFNHDYDLVWVWLNPVVLVSVAKNSNATSGTIIWNGYGYDYNDPLHEIDVWPVYVGYLNGDFKKADGTACYATDATCDPQDAGALARGWVTSQTFGTGQTAALNATDLATICAADPFCVNPNYLSTVGMKSGATPPTTADQRFTLSEFQNTTPQTLDYKQAGLNSTKGENFSQNDQYSTTNSTIQGGTYSYSQGVGLEEKFGGTFFGIGVQYDLKQTMTFMWTDSWQNTVTNTSTQTDIATITGPPCPALVAPCIPAYTEPHEFALYQDNLYGTFMFWPSPFFSLSVTPATKMVNAGSVATFQIPTAANAGYTGSLTSFSVAGLPTGASAAFSPSSGSPGFTSTLTVSTAASTPAGTYPLTISATDGALSYFACIPGGCPATGQPYATLEVVAQPNFSLAVTPTTQNIGIGAGATYTVTTAAMNGFAGVVNLNISGVPSGSSWTFSPPTVTGSGSSSLTINTTGNTPPGSYTLTITGTSGSLTQTTTATLVVTGGNFILSAVPEGQSITKGSSASYTVSLTGVSGFSGVVALSLSTLPTGAAYTFSPASLSAGGTSTLTITTSTTTPTGEYPLSITGTSGSLVQTAPVDLEVN